MVDGNKKMDEDNPLNVFPDGFDKLTIGTPINVDTNKILDKSRAFDFAKLRDQGLLVWSGGSTGTTVQVGGTDNKSQDSSGWSASTEVGLKTGIIDASAKFYVKQTLNASRRATNATVIGVGMATKTVDLLHVKREQYLRCATEQFGALLKEVSTKAKAAESDPALIPQLVAALSEFYEEFGTGFIDGLDLVAYGTFQATLNRDSQNSQDTFKIGCGGAVSFLFIGAKAESEWVKSHIDEHNALRFTAASFGRPPTCSLAKWAAGGRDALANKRIDEAFDTEEWQRVVTEQVAEPKNPDLSYTYKDLPDFDLPALPKIIGTAIKALKFRGLGLGDGTGLADEVLDGAIAKKLVEIKGETAVNEEQINARADLTGADEDASTEQSRQRAGAEASPSDDDDSTDSDGSSGAGGGGGGADFGDYSPAGYRYRPWKELFHELDLSQVFTTSQIVFAQSLVWFSIRGVFAQYLDFCANFPGVVLNDAGAEIDVRNKAKSFRNALQEVGDRLIERLQDGTPKLLYDEPDNPSFLHEMEAFLKKTLDKHHFSGFYDNFYEHYLFWIDNYGWLKKAPFGVVVLAESGVDAKGRRRYVYQANPSPVCPVIRPGGPGYQAARSISPSDLITKNAYRLYPIISTDPNGRPFFVWVGAPSLLTGNHEDAVRRFSGLLSFKPVPMEHPSYRVDEAINGADPRRIPVGERLDEMTLPMLIHQSAAAAEEFSRAENETHWWSRLGDPRTREQCLKERWENRKAMFGMHLYPGVGDDDGFGRTVWPPEPGTREERLRKAAARLLTVAGTRAREASQHATVQPLKNADGEYDDELWHLDPKAVSAAYSANHDAFFFWGPTEGPGWGPPASGPTWPKNLFEPRAVCMVPIDYGNLADADFDASAAENSQDREWIKAGGAWMESGGGPMWMQPRTELLTQLHELPSPIK